MNSAFEQWENRDVVELIDSHPFAWLVTCAKGFAATPLPIMVETDEAGRPANLLGHFAKSNPHVEHIRAEPRTLFLFSGPHGYISPEFVSTTRDWAPTWNYAVARIVADVRFDEALNHEALQRLVTKMERGRQQPWSTTEMGARYDQLKQWIVAFRADIVSIDARFKLGQDERPDVLADILSSLGESGLADWMSRFNKDRS